MSERSTNSAAPRLGRLRASRRTETDLLDAWTAQIGSAPDLHGALCRGSADWDHDRDREPVADREARLARAVATCERCPVLAQCRAWLDGLPKHRQPTGAVGGRIVRPPGVTTAGESKADLARRWLRDYLAHGEPVPVRRIIADAAAVDVNANTLRRVRAEVGVVSAVVALGEPVSWVLPLECRNTPSDSAQDGLEPPSPIDDSRARRVTKSGGL